MKLAIAFVFVGLAAVANAQTVKVMSYNIRLDTEADGVNQWGKRFHTVASLLARYDPDLLGVQEALHNQLADLQKQMPRYVMVGVGREDGKEKGEYSAIFFKKDKFEVVSQQTFWLSETPDVPGSKSWDAAITRIVTIGVFRDKATRQVFLYANTHFDHIGRQAREKSAELLKTHVSHWLAHVADLSSQREPAIIISGDFNAEPTEAPYQRMLDGNPVTLYDSRPADNTTGTFCGFDVGKMPCRVIDYIFHSRAWKASDYRVIQDHNGVYYPSDHLPVMVTLTRQP
ncbi:MAG: endonuclease/exonuclease/phosphatase family protein [Cyclobacteriaceae bacterium]|jgi:endonuclease/exonuclease/phosphatase family metal-dependent hydrolase|nr:endonuclease/exonuclease/phosphatase family protein [Cyclobacteriaceae bacterium]